MLMARPHGWAILLGGKRKSQKMPFCVFLSFHLSEIPYTLFVDLCILAKIS